MDISVFLPALGSILTALLGFVAVWLKRKAEAQVNQSKAEKALIQLGVIATGMAGRAWDALSPSIQAAFADGKMTAEERKQIEAKVQELLKDFASADDLANIASALGLPLPGLVAKIAAMLIEKFAFAHDPATPQGSNLAFPVAEKDYNGPEYSGG
jgi:uncharacterized membrane protein YebE (DUF533 family)